MISVGDAVSVFKGFFLVVGDEQRGVTGLVGSVFNRGMPRLASPPFRTI